MKRSRSVVSAINPITRHFLKNRCSASTLTTPLRLSESLTSTTKVIAVPSNKSWSPLQSRGHHDSVRHYSSSSSSPSPSPTLTHQQQQPQPQQQQQQLKKEEQSEGEKEGGKVTVWWDATCPLCTREISLLKSLTSSPSTGAGASPANIQFNALTKDSPSTIQISPTQQRSKTDLLKRFHVMSARGDLVSGAPAFLELYANLTASPTLSKFGKWAKQRTWVVGALERLYRIFLIGRPWVQRLVRRLEDAKK